MFMILLVAAVLAKGLSSDITDDSTAWEKTVGALLDASIVMAGAALGALVGFSLNQSGENEQRGSNALPDRNYEIRASGPGWSFEARGTGECSLSTECPVDNPPTTGDDAGAKEHTADGQDK